MLKLSKLNRTELKQNSRNLSRSAPAPSAVFIFITGEYQTRGTIAPLNIVDFPNIKMSTNELCKLFDFFATLNYYVGESYRDRVSSEGYRPSPCNNLGSPYIFVDQDSINNLTINARQFIDSHYGSPNVFPKLLMGGCSNNTAYLIDKLEGNQMTLSNIKKLYTENISSIFAPLEGERFPTLDVPFPCNI